MPTTPTFALRYPSGGDAATIALYLQNLASDVETLLATGFGWQNWTPQLLGSTTNPTPGSGSGAGGRYLKLGHLVIATGEVFFGSSGFSAGAGNYSFSLPVPAAAPSNMNTAMLGSGFAFQGGYFPFVVQLTSAGVQTLRFESATPTGATGAGATVTAANPAAPGASAGWRFLLNYEAA